MVIYTSAARKVTDNMKLFAALLKPFIRSLRLNFRSFFRARNQELTIRLCLEYL